jgi:hypothetical protein
MILSLERWLALTPSVASLQALTSRSSVRFRGVAPHHRSPTSAMQPAGQDLGAPLAPEINGQYRSNGARMPVLSGQCCRSRSATFDRRIAAADHSRETGSIATACLARSSSPLSPTNQSPHGGDFRGRRQIPPYWRVPPGQLGLWISRILPPRTLWPFCLCPLKPLFLGNGDRLDLRLVRGRTYGAPLSPNILES